MLLVKELIKFFWGLCSQENIFEWQFAIRGPGDTEFEGGIYHGRIQLPAEYPFKPPSFMLLTVRCCSLMEHKSYCLCADDGVLTNVCAFLPPSQMGVLKLRPKYA